MYGPVTIPTTAPETDGGLQDAGRQRGQQWAQEHGFEVSRPQEGAFVHNPYNVAVWGAGEQGDPQERILVWEDREQGCRVFARQ